MFLRKKDFTYYVKFIVFIFMFFPLITYANQAKLNQPKSKPPSPTKAMACDDQDYHQCAAVGYDATSPEEECDGLLCFYPIGFYTTDHGETWRKSWIERRRHGGDTYQTLDAIACDTTGLRCVAVGSGNVGYRYEAVPLSNVSYDGGKTWNLSAEQAEPFPIGSHYTVAEINAISCDANLVKCVMVGHGSASDEMDARPITYLSKDGGNSWKLSSRLPERISGFTSLTEVGCDFKTKECNATGYYAENHISEDKKLVKYVSHDLGDTWETKRLN